MVIKKPLIDSNFFATMIAEAKIQQSSRYFEPGLYLVQIDNCKFFANRHGRPRAAVDCTVVASNNSLFPETSQVTWVVSLDTDSGPSTVKTFIASLFKQTDSKSITAADVNKIFVKDGSMNVSSASGMHALVNVYTIKTVAGSDFSKHEWRHFNIESDAIPDFENMAKVKNTQVPEGLQLESNAALAVAVPF
jgi:hypothetical protein